MNINSTERHEHSHVAVLSKEQVENLIREAIRSKLDLPVGGAAGALTWRFEWGEASIDSGLRKEPQITVRLTHDLAPKPSVTLFHFA